MMIDGTSARVTLQGPGTGMGGVESESWLAPFPVLESSAPRFVGIGSQLTYFEHTRTNFFI